MSRDTKGSVKISTGAVVCNESELRGDITIGARTVIHPKAKIIAESGPIIIGNHRDCGVQERNMDFSSKMSKICGENSQFSQNPLITV